MLQRYRRRLTGVALTTAFLFIFGCYSAYGPRLTETEGGSLLGALYGAGIGAAIGSASDHTGEGAGIGALAGTILGGILGYAVERRGNYDEDPYYRGGYNDDPYYRGGYNDDPYYRGGYPEDSYGRGDPYRNDDRYYGDTPPYSGPQQPYYGDNSGYTQPDYDTSYSGDRYQEQNRRVMSPGYYGN